MRKVWTGHVASTQRGEVIIKLQPENLHGKRSLADSARQMG